MQVWPALRATSVTGGTEKRVTGMAVEFILGSSGEERAEALYRKAIALSEDPEKKIIIIVPEQYTLETQKGMIALHPRHAILNTDVVSFNRLAYKVIEKEGAGTKPIIRESGKSMIVRRILNANASRLKFFSSQAGICLGI